MEESTRRGDGAERLKPRFKLLEVISVRLLTSNRDNRRIYGTIEVGSHDSNGNYISYVIFNRADIVPQFVSPPGFLTLTGPKENAIPADSAVYVRFNLFDKNGQNEEMNRFETDQLEKRDLLFNVVEDPSGVNHILCKEFQTNCGIWELTFVPYTDAAQATVQVSLVNWNWDYKDILYSGPLNVLAKVTAENNELRDCAEISLLCKLRPYESFSVDLKNGRIPLSRSVIVVPCDSLLRVKVGIWLCQDDYADREELCISESTALFAYLSGKDHENLRGKLGEVKVEVTWGCQ